MGDGVGKTTEVCCCCCRCGGGGSRCKTLHMGGGGGLGKQLTCVPGGVGGGKIEMRWWW